MNEVGSSKDDLKALPRDATHEIGRALTVAPLLGEIADILSSDTADEPVDTGLI